MSLPSEDYIRAHGQEFKQRGATNSARWYVLDGVAYHSRARGHMEVSSHNPPFSATWILHLVPVEQDDE